MGPYIVLSFVGYSDMKIINRLYAHNERTTCNRMSNKNIDESRSWQNYHIKDCCGKYSDVIAQFVERTGKPCSRSNLLIDGLIFLSPEWFEGRPIEAQKEMFAYAYKYVSMMFHEDNIIDAVVHMDETTPHMHFEAVPYCDGRIAQSAIAPYPDGAQNIIEGLYYFMHEKYPEFEKPIPSKKSKRRSVSITMYKACPDFFNLHNQMYFTLRNINLLNFSRKKDEIMSLYTRISQVAAQTMLRNKSYIEQINNNVLPRLEEELEKLRRKAEGLEKDNRVCAGTIESKDRIIASLKTDVELVNLLQTENRKYKSEMQMLRCAIKEQGEKSFEEIIATYNKLRNEGLSLCDSRQII